MEKDCHPGCWDSSSSGHLDCGETYDVAAVRELHEELGIEVEELSLIGSLPASGMTGQEFVRIYLAKHEGPFALHPGEISDGRWVTIQELQSWLNERPDEFAPCFHAVWEVSCRSVYRQ
jgi:isopentenyldiphosphate isomerase